MHEFVSFRKTILMVLLLIFHATLSFTKEEGCTVQDGNCKKCLSNADCHYCSQTNTCELRTSNCSSFRVDYFEFQKRKEVYEEIYHGKYPPSPYEPFPVYHYDWNATSICNANQKHTIDDVDECPVFTIEYYGTSTQQGVWATTPLDKQPLMLVKGDGINETRIDFLSTSVGVYCLDCGGMNVSAFSFIYDVLKEPKVGGLGYLSAYAPSDLGKFIVFLDMAIVSRPRTYKLGYSVGILKNDTYHCLFKPYPSKTVVLSNWADFFTLQSNFNLIIISFVIWFPGIILVGLCSYKQCWYEKIPESYTDEIVYSPREIRISNSLKKLSPLKRIFVMILSIFITPAPVIVQKVGLEAFYFFRFEEAIVGCSVCFALVSFWLFPMYGLQKDFEIADVGRFTLGAIMTPKSFFDKPILIPVFIVCILYMCIFAGMLIFIMKSARLRVRLQENVEDQVIRLRNVSRKLLDQTTLLKAFQSIYGEKRVLAAYIAYDLRKLHPIMEKVQALTKKHKKTEHKVKKRNLKYPNRISTPYWIATFCCCFCKRDGRRYYRDQIKAKQEKMIQLIKKEPLRGSSNAFIVFSKPEFANQCLSDFQEKKEVIQSLKTFGLEGPGNDGTMGKMEDEEIIRKNCSSWWTQPSPAAWDINFHNLGYRKPHRVALYSISTILCVLAVLFSALIVVSFSSFKEMKAWSQRVIESILHVILNGGPIVDLNSAKFEFNQKLVKGIETLATFGSEFLTLLNIFLVPIAKGLSSIDRHQTKTGENNRELQVGFFMTLITTHISSKLLLMIIGYYTAIRIGSNLYFMIRISLEIYKFGSTLLIFFKSLEILFFVYLPVLMGLIKHKKLIRMYFPRGFYNGTYSLRFLFFGWILLYGPFIPLGPLMMCISLFFTYLVDKFMILYYYHRSSNYDGRLLVTSVGTMSYILLAYPYFMLFITGSYFSFYWVLFAAISIPLSIALFILVRIVMRVTKEKKLDISLDSTTIIPKFHRVNQFNAQYFEKLIQNDENDPMDDDLIDAGPPFSEFQHPLYHYIERATSKSPIEESNDFPSDTLSNDNAPLLL